MDNELINVIGIALTLKDILLIVSSFFFGSGIFSIAFIFFIFKKQFRQFRNLKKPVIFIDLRKEKTPDFEKEKDLFKSSGFFNIVEVTSNSTDLLLDKNDEYGFVIVGVSDGSVTDFEELLKTLNSLECPSMIYTFGDSNALKREEFSLLHKYKKIGISNSPTRLLGDVFNILSVYP